MKRALITGITGQDGSYLAELLLEKGYEVHGMTRRASLPNTERIAHLLDQITLHDGDLSDSSSIIRILRLVEPDEVYNLAAQSHVQVSFDVPEYSGDVDALGVLRLLEGIRILGMEKTCRFYQASTSELYGKVEEVPQKETTPFHPYSPYAVAKQYGYWIVKEYREAYGMFAVNGILFNHESERRGENFVTRKITLGVTGEAPAGEPGQQAGLGIRQGLRGVHVADAPARAAGGFRDRHGGAAYGAGVHDAGVCPRWDCAGVAWERPGGNGRRQGHRKGAGGGEPGLVPAHRCGQPVGRPHQGKDRAGLGPSEDQLRAAVRHHG